MMNPVLGEFRMLPVLVQRSFPNQIAHPAVDLFQTHLVDRVVVLRDGQLFPATGGTHLQPVAK